MNSEHSPTSTAATAERRAAEVGIPTDEFTMRFSSTPRGARLARRLVADRLHAWGHPHTSTANETLTLITSELTANAVRHGHVQGRDFEVRLLATSETLRVEVSDTRAERVPPRFLREAPSDAETGRGLLLVATLADRWGVEPRTAGPGKTVWAEAVCPLIDRSPALGMPR
ncbi:ATP-binding protein [Streptomyces europaeiscabiei]|uniref:ATP-binding protein n=1 Tax=Streptomyces europaeiscabiei TaxID=146819 RepID=UPI0029A34878|nr:ATP-binding protein [Streptomyces europaeiscabiei]MDX3580241.1 ATP-binding protein [Streptomyces europaeiscabiei]